MITSCLRRHQPLALAVALALGSTAAHAANITVTDGGDAGTASTCTLRQAIVSSNSDSAAGSTCVAGSGTDVIDFDAGLSGATITLAGNPLQILNSSVTINGSGQTIDGNNASGDLVLYNAVADVSNLTFTGGNTPYDGGGILVVNSNLTLTQSTVSGNTSAQSGGGIASYIYLAPGRSRRHSAARRHMHFTPAASGNPIVTGVLGSSVTLVGSSVSGNTAQTEAGGILSANHTQLYISNSSISGNQLNAADNYGAGGIYLAYYSAGAISDSTIAGNNANGAVDYAYLTGGVYLFESTLTMTNCTVSGNSASGPDQIAGGLSDSHYNTTPGYGLTLANTTVSGNTASSGGGYGTGGLLVGAYSSGDASVQNTIISGNTGPSDNNVLVYYGSATASYSLLGSSLSGTLAGSGNVYSDSPGLGALADNGGPTLTRALLAGSPAIDAGSNALIPSGVQYDQRGAGYPRIQNTTVDIGSFEFAGAAPPPAFVSVPASSFWSRSLLAMLAGMAAMLGLASRRRRHRA